MSKMKRFNYFYTAKQIEELKKLSTETGLSVSELIRRAIDEYTQKKKYEKKDI